MESTGIVKRIDYKEYSKDISRIILFCAHCNPEGKGGNGGIIFSTDHNFDTVRTQALNAKRFFCPTCGRKINYGNIVECRPHSILLSMQALLTELQAEYDEKKAIFKETKDPAFYFHYQGLERAITKLENKLNEVSYE